MLPVALERFPTLEFNELQSEQYLTQNNSFYNQGLSHFQVTVINKYYLILHALLYECLTASGNLCFRVFKLQLKVINKNVCFL